MLFSSEPKQKSLRPSVFAVKAKSELFPTKVEGTIGLIGINQLKEIYSSKPKDFSTPLEIFSAHNAVNPRKPNNTRIYLSLKQSDRI